MRRWLNLDIDLHTLGIGPLAAQPAGLLPATTLPLIAAVLGAFYEADNTPQEATDDKAPKSKGKDAAKSKTRVADVKADLARGLAG